MISKVVSSVLWAITGLFLLVWFGLLFLNICNISIAAIYVIFPPDNFADINWKIIDNMWASGLYLFVCSLLVNLTSFLANLISG